jgi:hypothetical protein
MILVIVAYFTFEAGSFILKIETNIGGYYEKI